MKSKIAGETIQGMLHTVENAFPYADVVKVNAKKGYILLDLLDEIGIYRVSIQKTRLKSKA